MIAESRSEKWHQFYVDGATAVISSGNCVTLNTGKDCPPYWFSGPSTIILGRSPRPEPDPTTVTMANWEIPINTDTILAAERAFLIVSCIRNFGGLHTLKKESWAGVWFNNHCIDAFQLMVIPDGHSDYFHRQPVLDLPNGFVFSDSYTRYAWPLRSHVFAKESTQQLNIRIDPDVRWDIDHVAIIILEKRTIIQ